MIMLKSRNIQIIGGVVFVLVIAMWFLATNVSKHERQAAEEELGKQTAKDHREISQLRTIIRSMESEAALKKSFSKFRIVIP